MNAGRALVISPRLPEFDRESGLLRVSHMIDMLLRRGWEVTFGCLRPPTDPERYARDLEQRGVEVHAPLRKLDSIRDVDGFDLAIIAFWHVAERFLPELREASPSTRVIVDSVDLHFVREMRDKLRVRRRVRSGPARDEARRVSWSGSSTPTPPPMPFSPSPRRRRHLINDLTGRPDLALTLPDTEELAALAGAAERAARESSSSATSCTRPTATPPHISARRSCRASIRRCSPSTRSRSSAPTAAEQVRGSGRGLPHVKIVGWVPSVIPYLNSARVSVVPLRYGAGTKRKIVQALMVGTPTVTTVVGAEGLGVRDRREVLIADDPSEFAGGDRTSAATPARLARAGAPRSQARSAAARTRRRSRRASTRCSRRCWRGAPGAGDRSLTTARGRRHREETRIRSSSSAGSARSSSPTFRGTPRCCRDTRRRRVPRLRGTKRVAFPPGPRRKVRGLLPRRQRGGDRTPRGAAGRGRHAPGAAADRASGGWTTTRRCRTHLDAAYRQIRSDEDAIVYELTGEASGSPTSARRADPTPRRGPTYPIGVSAS